MQLKHSSAFREKLYFYYVNHSSFLVKGLVNIFQMQLIATKVEEFCRMLLCMKQKSLGKSQIYKKK